MENCNSTVLTLGRRVWTASWNVVQPPQRCFILHLSFFSPLCPLANSRQHLYCFLLHRSAGQMKISVARNRSVKTLVPLPCNKLRAEQRREADVGVWGHISLSEYFLSLLGKSQPLLLFISTSWPPVCYTRLSPQAGCWFMSPKICVHREM